MSRDQRIDDAMKEGRAVGNILEPNCWICTFPKITRQYHNGTKIISMMICPRCDGSRAQPRQVKGTF